MIVVDTSAFIAVALDEPAAEACSDIMAQADEIVVSAGGSRIQGQSGSLKVSIGKPPKTQPVEA